MANPKYGVELDLIYKNFEAGLAKAEKGLDKFDKEIDKVAANSKNINTALEKTSRSMISFGDVIGAIGLYQLTDQFTQFLSSAYQGAAAFEALALGNKALAASIGTTTAALAAGTQAAALGMIDDAEAIRQANEAIMTGAVGSQAEMEEMTRIAVSLGIAMGKTAAESIDIFTTALGKGQPRLLYQLGITLDVDKAEQAYAATLGKTAEALTDLEKKEAVRTAALARGRDVMQQMGDVSGLQIVKMQQLKTSWDEFGDSFGAFLVSIENSTGAFDILGGFIGDLREGAEAWGYVLNEAIPAIQKHNEEVAQATEAARANTIATAEQTASYGDLISMADNIPLDELQRMLVENTATFQGYTRAVNELSIAYPTLGEMLKITAEDFSAEKIAAQEAAKALEAVTVTIGSEVGAWRDLETTVAAAAEQQRLLTGVSLYGIQISNWYTEALGKEAAGWQFLDAQTKKAADTEAAAQKARQDGWIKSTSSLASYILAAQDATAGLTGGGTGGADAEKTANDARVQNKTDLNTKLAQLDQERSDKIAWVHSGDWARTAEQNAADLQFWNDHYDKLQSETILGYTGRNVEIQKAEDAAKAIAAKAAAEEQAAYAARMLDLRTSAALTIMETQGTLTQFTGGMATTAADALEKMKAGVIAITPDMASALAGTVAGVNADMATATANQITNLAMLKDAQDGVINNSATLAGITSDAVDQVTIPPETVTQIDSIAVALTRAMTMFDTLATKSAENKTIFFESIKALPDAVDEVAWDDEVGKPIVDGIAKGLTDNTTITNDAMRGLVMQMLAAATSAAGAQSPATEFMPLGVDIANGILAGMNSTGEQINSTAQDLMHNLMKNFVGGRGFGSDLRRRVLEQFDGILEDMTIGGADTYQDVLQRAIEQMLSGMSGAVRAIVQQQLPDLWAAMGDLVQQTIISPLERAAQMFSLGGIMGSLASTALALERAGMAESIAQLQELDKAMQGYTAQLGTLDNQLGTIDDQLGTIDDQIADAQLRISLGFGGEEQVAALMEQVLALEDQRGEVLRNKIAAQEEIDRLNVEAMAIEAEKLALDQKQLALQEAQTKLQFLQQQMSLVKTIQDAGLNPADILGGLQLGIDADLNAIVLAMTAAMNAILQQAESTLGLAGGGSFTVPPGYPNDRFRVGLTSGERVVVTPAGFQMAGNSVNVTFGNVSISNGWDVAILRSQVTQWVADAVGA